MSAGCLEAMKKQEKSGQHRRGVSWRLRYTVPIDEQIRAQALHSQSLSPKKNWWCFSAKRVMSGRIVLVATCILVCTAPFQTLQFSDCAVCRHQEKKVRAASQIRQHDRKLPHDLALPFFASFRDRRLPCGSCSSLFFCFLPYDLALPFLASLVIKGSLPLPFSSPSRPSPQCLPTPCFALPRRL